LQVTWQLAAAIALRNLIITFVVYSLWHYAMYVKIPPMSTKKYNPKFPPAEEHVAARRWTLLGSLVASAYELLAIHFWSAAGTSVCFTSVVDAPLYTFALWLVAVFVRYDTEMHCFFLHCGFCFTAENCST